MTNKPSDFKTHSEYFRKEEKLDPSLISKAQARVAELKNVERSEDYLDVNPADEEAWREQCLKLKDENEALKKQVERLALNGVDFKIEDRDAVISSNKNIGLAIICHSIKDTLGDAPNFITMSAKPRGGPEMEVTIKRKNGITPGEKLEQLEAERDALQKHFDAVSAEMHQWENVAKDAQARVAELENLHRLQKQYEGASISWMEYKAARDAAFKGVTF